MATVFVLGPSFLQSGEKAPEWEGHRAGGLCRRAGRGPRQGAWEAQPRSTKTQEEIVKDERLENAG